jgi:hypothetical protein
MAAMLRRAGIGIAMLALAAGIGTVVAVRPVASLPMYSARTGMTCRSCHFDPNGGGPRNALGFTYGKQRHDLAPDTDPRWAELTLSNRIGDAVYLGTNTRLAYLYSAHQDATDETDLSSFYQMQGALNVVFQPFQQLALVMVRDFGEFSGDETRDIFGLLQDSGGHFALKAGKVRPVFGLRQDEHESATRGGFLGGSTGRGGGLLPYDPRVTESGIAGHMFRGGLELSASLTNGGSAFANKAQAGAVKLTSTIPNGQIGVSGYDNFTSVNGARASRWSGYALMRMPGKPDFTVMGEVGAGTDDDGAGGKRNVLATFLEADYRLNRSVLLRGKYDFSDVHRSVPGNAAERFYVESDLTLVPFCDLKLSYRHIIPESAPNVYELVGMVYVAY